MKEEFPEVFEEIFLNSMYRFRRALRRKKEALSHCKKYMKQAFFDPKLSKMNRAVTFS